MKLIYMEHRRLIITIIICLPLYYLALNAFFDDLGGLLGGVFTPPQSPLTGGDMREMDWMMLKLTLFILSCVIMTYGVSNLIARWL